MCDNFRNNSQQLRVRLPPLSLHATRRAQSSDLHKRLSHVLVTLQEHIRDRSFSGLLSRLQLIAEKHRLKCVMQGQQFYLTSDSFFVEVRVCVCVCLARSIGLYAPPTRNVVWTCASPSLLHFCS